MKIEDELKHPVFEDAFMKAVLNIMVTADKLGSSTNAVLKPFGISKEQYNVLRILKGQYPKPTTIQDITSRMIAKSSNATRLVEKMRQKGLVERTPCGEDRRKVDVLITRQGLAMLERVNPLVKAGGKRFGNISEEEAVELNRILDKLRG